MVNRKLKVSIGPERASEYEIVNELIFTAFAAQHGEEIGQFMKNHFIEERNKETFIPQLSLATVLENGIIAGEIALHETDIITDRGSITQLVLCQSAALPNSKSGVLCAHW